VQTVVGLPDAPRLANVLEMGISASRAGRAGESNRPPPRRLSLAVSDDGAFVLFASGEAVRVLSGDGEDRHLIEAGAGTLVAFAPNGKDAAVAGTRGAGIVFFKDVAGATVRRTLAAAGVAGAGGLAFSADGSKLFVASPVDRAVIAFQIESGERSAIACNCQPDGLTRMGALYRLNELGSGPLWLLDSTGAEPRTVFVPAATAN
jgi:hypothetical protein